MHHADPNAIKTGQAAEAPYKRRCGVRDGSAAITMITLTYQYDFRVAVSRTPCHLTR